MIRSKLFHAIEITKATVSMKEACEHYGLTFNRAGFARCPFHNERTASFKIHNNHGHCFGCGWYGDQIDFARRYYGYQDNIETLKQMQRDFLLPFDLEKTPSLFEQHQLAMKYHEVKSARETEKRAEERTKAERNALEDMYALLDLWRIRYAPQSPDEEFDPRYVEAVKYIDYYKYRIFELEVKKCSTN